MVYFYAVLINIICMINVSYSQNYECDNNFGDCGTPEQSGGGGAGGGSILVANTDLGDTYQHADDFDDDGIEDSSDNCTRIMNTDQVDRDGDGVGDACDNCLEVWNISQEDTDGDSLGDFCDSDDDNDGILDTLDECPYHWGEESCFLLYELNNLNSDDILKNKNNIIPIFNKDSASIKRDSSNNKIIYSNGCNTTNNNKFNNFLFLIIFILLFKKKKEINCE